MYYWNGILLVPAKFWVSCFQVQSQQPVKVRQKICMEVKKILGFLLNFWFPFIVMHNILIEHSTDINLCKRLDMLSLAPHSCGLESHQGLFLQVFVAEWLRLCISDYLPHFRILPGTLESFIWGSYPASLQNVSGSTQVPFYACNSVWRSSWGLPPPVKAWMSPYNLNSVGVTDFKPNKTINNLCKSVLFKFNFWLANLLL